MSDRTKQHRMVWSTLAGLWLSVMPLGVDSAPADQRTEVIQDADLYFPDSVGTRWRYRGRVEEWPLQKIAVTSGYVNVSSVMGTQTIKGVAVKVFHDTNPGNHGPTESYYRRDAAGIVYYGSSPGTPVEKQVVPYQIVRFPVQIPSSFQQFERKQLDWGSDLDKDGVNERVDVEASVSVTGRDTVTVPAGSYQQTIRMEARMSMKIHLSGSKRAVIGTDVLIAWFAKGIGLIKYTEHQEMPPMTSDRGWITEISEELEEVEIKASAASFSRPD